MEWYAWPGKAHRGTDIEHSTFPQTKCEAKATEKLVELGTLDQKKDPKTLAGF